MSGNLTEKENETHKNFTRLDVYTHINALNTNIDR